MFTFDDNGSHMAEQPTPRQRAILYAAARLFCERGYAATTIRDIGDTQGIASAALYYHFANKDEILVRVMLLGVRAVHEGVDQAMAEAPTTFERIRAGLRAHILTTLTHQDFATVLLQEIRYLKPADRRAVIAARDEYESLWARVLSEGQAEGLFKPDVDIHMLRLLGFGAMNWIVIWYRPDGDYIPEQIADAFVEYIGKGVFRPEVMPTS